VALRQLLDQLEALQVASARAHGWSWERIATAASPISGSSAAAAAASCVASLMAVSFD
jgi:hypothetical protein